MAGFCRWWRISPIDYRMLTHGEIASMYEFMREERAEREKAQRRQESAARRHR